MPDICLGFEVHQPYRLDQNFDSDSDVETDELFDLYFDHEWNKEILERVSEKCYIPANETILENIEKYSGEDREFKVSFSISGVLLWQLNKWCPKVIETFRDLAETGNVEFLNQTYYHSLSSLYSKDKLEFEEQVKMHENIISEYFGQNSNVFENTEFLFNNSIAEKLEKLGYRGVFTEGVEDFFVNNSSNNVYDSESSDLKVFPRNYKLSDDIAFRFSKSDWDEFPLTADKYAAWLSRTDGQCANIFVDYETFGEHQWPETGIFDFLSWLPGEVLKYENNNFVTPSELLEKGTVGEVDVGDFETISWADESRDTRAWLGNDMQRECFSKLKNLEHKVKEIDDEEILKIWRFLQISDHLYYMYTAPGESKEVHNYFSQQSPYEAYKTMKEVLIHFENHLDDRI